jgi:hypothetical protein
MLTDNAPTDILIEWAENSKIVKFGKDRPWFYAKPPSFGIEHYQPHCRCHTVVKLGRYPCEDGAGYMYVGQCTYCETIIWSYLECSGK